MKRISSLTAIAMLSVSLLASPALAQQQQFQTQAEFYQERLDLAKQRLEDLGDKPHRNEERRVLNSQIAAYTKLLKDQLARDAANAQNANAASAQQAQQYAAPAGGQAPVNTGHVAVAAPPAALQPGQPGFPAPTAMHLDPCGDGVEGAKYKTVKKHWDKVQDKFKDAHKDALNDDLSGEQAQQAAAEAASRESIKRGGNRWDASLAAAAAIRFYTTLWVATGHAAYYSAIRNGASEHEAAAIARWAMQRVYPLTMGWTLQMMLAPDRACSRPAYMVQQNLAAMAALSGNSGNSQQQAMGNAFGALMLGAALSNAWGHHGHYNQHEQHHD
ncbi:MAG: hypothetical protein QNJ92_05035 [Alphaproteobacteria bacterium]|nr:hypothetical protein [Alphaproteobacteria bacterium]